jgi:hypothetical protein
VPLSRRRRCSRSARRRSGTPTSSAGPRRLSDRLGRAVRPPPSHSLA